MEPSGYMMVWRKKAGFGRAKLESGKLSDHDRRLGTMLFQSKRVYA
jgi:hypothetical protein